MTGWLLDTILRAASEAEKILDQSPCGNRTSFDIIGEVADRNIPLLFRPLEKLWGAFIAVDDHAPGIIVTTSLGLPAQRFTLAHELGHLLLAHGSSLDETIGFAGRNGPPSKPHQEVAADTFALELLGAKRLLMDASERHGWTANRLHAPDNIYQLSLRLGIPYTATCWALVTSNVLTHKDAIGLQAKSLKDLKRALAPAELLKDPEADVWTLTEADAGTFLEAGQNDLFAVQVQDHASAGFIWRLVDAKDDVGTVAEEDRIPSHAYGIPPSRTVYVKFASPGVHQLVFEHVRPWSGATLDRIEIAIDDHGKEREGHSRRTKLRALEQRT